MPISTHTAPFPEQLSETICTLYRTIFDTPDDQKVRLRLRTQTGMTVQLFCDAQECPLGFKLGYPAEAGVFYSWLGGVLPEARAQGIGAQLMAAQHDWCRAARYHTVRTKTLNRWRSMLLLNIRAGFDIVALEDKGDGIPRIILEKAL